jgi:PAS domain S-box-containing protein
MANTTQSRLQQPGSGENPRNGNDSWITSWLKRFNSRLKLRIKGKLTIAFVGFSAIPILVIGTLLWIMTMQSMRSSALRELAHLADLINIRLEEFTETVRTDIRFIHEGLTPIEAGDSPHELEILEQQVFNVMRTKPRYYRLTYLVDSLQAQLFCYQRDLDRRERVFPTRSHYSWAYYRLLVADLKEGQMRLTPIEHLDRESGRTLAAFSFALPRRTPDGRLTGIFIADVFADQIFSLIETTLARETRYTAGLVDREGHYLYHSQKKQDWNRLLAEASLHTLDKEFAPATAERIVKASPGTIVTDDGDVIYHIPLAMGALGLNQDYYFYLVEPGTVIFAPLRKFGLIFILSMLAFVAIALYLSRLATLQFVRPIRKLQQGSDIIARGDFQHRLHIDSGDEIEELAETFNTMAASIAERDQQLQEINAYLEQKVQERTRELQDEKNKLRIILDNVPSAFILLSSDRTVLTASSALKSLTGHSPGEAIGKKCYEVLGSINDCDHCLAKFASNDHSISRREYKIETGTDETRTFELVNVPVRLTSGEEACLEILSDITERVQLQHQLLQSEKLASIGEMAAVIAHEIRNSLTSANMLLQLIHESQKLDRSDRESLDVVLSSINRINEITQDLLAFARPAPLQPEPTKITDILEETFTLYKHLLDQHRIQYRLQAPEALPTATVDRNLMQEVFGNILLNSCQAIQEEGQITVKAEVIPVTEDLQRRLNRSKSSYPASFDGNRVRGPAVAGQVFRICFEDDGPGIPTQNLEKVFDPFYTTKTNGTGLGLSLARRVVEAHGGTIYASNATSGGTTIYILLPVEATE